MRRSRGKKASAAKKRHLKENPKSSEDSPDNPNKTAASRPKRKCTLNQRKIYNESDTIVVEANVGPGYNEDQESPEKAALHDNPLIQKNVVDTSPRKKASSAPFNRQKNASRSQQMVEMKAKYKWIDHEFDTAKVRCRICNAANLTKWFILANENIVTLENSLKLHEASEEHRRSLKGRLLPSSAKSKLLPKHITPVTKTAISSNIIQKSRKSGDINAARDVYCIPMECLEPIPVPGAQLRSFLASHGLKGRVNFTAELTPAKLRQDISKAFATTFSLRSQELLQFDYLELSENGTELVRPVKMLHFDAKTVLSFVGDKEMYILLKQKNPVEDVNWNQLVFQESQLRNLADAEYKEVMLSVMHRISSGKHKKDSTEEQKTLVESLIDDYKLNNYHQLVYVGNSLDQLVLFTEKRRCEAFDTAHAGHSDLHTTFKKIFNLYYWNGIEEWVSRKIRDCAKCLAKYGEHALTSAAIDLGKIEEEIKQKKTSYSRHSKASLPLAPRPAQQPEFVQRIVPIPKQTAKSPPSAAGKSSDFQVASIMPPMSLSRPAKSREKNLSPTAVKKEPDSNKEDLIPPEIDSDHEMSDRDGTLYEEDLEQAIQQNSKDRSDGSHCVNAMWAMYLLEQRGMFCDFFIMLLPSAYNNLKKPKIYGVHRIVFAAISSRVRKITKTTIKIGGKVTCEGLENVIEYGYTGRLTGIHDMQLGTITQISNTAMALDIKIDHYLQKQRPDFTKTSAKVLVTSNPGDKTAMSASSDDSQGPILCS